jgi:sensor histidine kinase YesM
MGGGDFSRLVTSMFLNVIPAAIYGLGVIWICNRLNWSFHRRSWFFPLHFALALVYSFAWAKTIFLLLTLEVYLQTGTWKFISFVANALQWQVFSGIMIYVTVGSVVYVLQVVQNLREEERRAARAETLYAQNALSALQAQLNPHFLFNTLHSLMALIRYNPQTAEAALEKLAEMLRYTLKEKRHSQGYLVRLEEELNFVENYLELEKLRLGDRLSVQKEIEPNTLDYLLPAFTIQPLIENSIRHGIAPRNIRAKIFISAKKENDLLKLEIADDGIGSNDEKIKNSKGLGIALVREQLQIQYGEKSFFEIQTEQNNGFKVLITIPVSRVQTFTQEKQEFDYSHVNS